MPKDFIDLFYLLAVVHQPPRWTGSPSIDTSDTRMSVERIAPFCTRVCSTITTGARWDCNLSRASASSSD